MSSDRIYIAPSGVQKERIKPEDIFTCNMSSEIVCKPADQSLKLSQCTPLFMNSFALRDANACIHSHSVNAAMVTMLCKSEFVITHQEMIKVFISC